MTTILTYPELPTPSQKLYEIGERLDVRFTGDPAEARDLAILWTFETTYEPDIDVSGFLNAPGGQDVRKSRVAHVFEQVFGYALAVDPTTWAGMCVEKREAQCTKSGRIVRCPQEPAPGKVYERLIDTRQPGGTLQDIRVPVAGSEIPYIACKTRPLSNPFGTKDVVQTIHFGGVLTPAERRLCLRFARVFGTPFCDLDVLRDSDGRLFVVDVNNVAGRIGGDAPRGEMLAAMDAYAAAFARQFLGS